MQLGKEEQRAYFTSSTLCYHWAKSPDHPILVHLGDPQRRYIKVHDGYSVLQGLGVLVGHCALLCYDRKLSMAQTRHRGCVLDVGVGGQRRAGVTG